MSEPFALQGHRVLVTGASSGIGRAVAILLDRLGAELVLVGRSETRLAETSGVLSGTGHVLAVQDLSDVEGLSAFLKGLTSSSRLLDGLVHCAGVSSRMPIRMQDWKSAREVMDLNWGAAWGLAKAFRQKGVRTPGGGRVVFVSSSASLIGETAMSAYSSSKGAVNALVRSLASEFAADRITVNAIAPGFILTEMNESYLAAISDEQRQSLERRHPLGFGSPADVAAAVAYLLAESGRWVTGVVLPVDGGLTAV